MYKGILNINKERGISSARVVSLVRRALGMKKVGHTGTLDLKASGVLPIVVGKATRVSDYMMGKDKTYETDLVFGTKTDTLDGAGKVIAESDKIITKADLLEAMGGYRGEISQLPPMFSALKKDGKKLYELAREGKTVKRKARKVHIYGLELIDFDFPRARIRVKCSKGTYIRTLVDDIGEDLGCFAYADELVRVKVGDFSIKESIKSEDILNIGKDKLIEALYPIDSVLSDIKRVDLSEDKLFSLINGQKLPVDMAPIDEVRVYAGDTFIGLGSIKSAGSRNFLKMEKVFYEREDQNL